MNKNEMIELLKTFKDELAQKADSNLEIIRQDLNKIDDSFSRKLGDLRLEVEKLKRERNVIIYGLSIEKAASTYSAVTTFVKDTLGVPLREEELDLIRILGPKAKQLSELPRPLLVKFTTLRKKIQVLTARPKLKNSKISVSEDFPKEIQERRKALLPELREARAKGLKAFIKYDKLVVPKPAPVQLNITSTEASRMPLRPNSSPTPANTPDPEDAMVRPLFSELSDTSPKKLRARKEKGKDRK